MNILNWGSCSLAEFKLFEECPLLGLFVHLFSQILSGLDCLFVISAPLSLVQSHLVCYSRGDGRDWLWLALRVSSLSSLTPLRASCLKLRDWFAWMGLLLDLRISRRELANCLELLKLMIMSSRSRNVNCFKLTVKAKGCPWEAKRLLARG